jgi:hypothetical protein
MHHRTRRRRESCRGSESWLAWRDAAERRVPGYVEDHAQNVGSLKGGGGHRELPLTGLSFAFPRQARRSLPFSSRQGYPAALITGVLPTD